MREERKIDLRRLVRGDEAEWDLFVDRLSPCIYSAAHRTLAAYRGKADRWDVEDVAQSVFLRLVKKDYRLLRSYSPAKASLVTWLTIVSRSAAIDFLRRRRPETLPFDESRMDVTSVAPPPDSSIELPPGLLSARQRLVLHLMFDQGMNGAEVAEILGVNAQTVRSTKHKAIKRLRSFFSKGG